MGADLGPESLAPLRHDWICSARDVEMELERYRVRSKGGSLMPLTYALVALDTLCGRAPDPTDHDEVDAAMNSAVHLVEQELGEQLDNDSACGPIRRLLAGIRSRVPAPPLAIDGFGLR